MAAPGPSVFVAQTSAQRGRNRKLITEAGNQIMQDFINQGNYKPTLQQKKDILARIRALPGCEEYRMANLESWFRRRRETHEKEKGVATGPGQARPVQNDSRYPSINPKKMQALETMFNQNQNPSQEVKAAWVLLTEANPEDLENWVKDKQAALQPSNMIYQPRPPILTTVAIPSSSAPTPTPAIRTVFKYEALESPVIPSPSSASISGYHSHSHTAMSPPSATYPSARSTTTPRMSIPPPEAPSVRRDELLLAIHSAIETRSGPDGNLPGTAKEFDEQYAPYEKTFNNFLAKLENGELANWGFRKDMIR